MLRPPKARGHRRMGNGSWWRKRKKKMGKKGSCALCTRPLRERDVTEALSGRQVKRCYQGVVNDGESYADILKAMKVKVNPQNAGAEVLSTFGKPGGRRSSWSSERGVTYRSSKRRSTRRSGRRPKLNLWSRRGPLKLGTSTRQSQESLLSRWASQTLGTSAGCTNALTVCRQRWSVDPRRTQGACSGSVG